MRWTILLGLIVLLAAAVGYAALRKRRATPEIDVTADVLVPPHGWHHGGGILAGTPWMIPQPAGTERTGPQ